MAHSRGPVCVGPQIGHKKLLFSFDNLGIFEKKDNFQKLKINFEKLLKENDINLIKKLFEDKDYNKELDINKLIEIYNDNKKYNRNVQ